MNKYTDDDKKIGAFLELIKARKLSIKNMLELWHKIRKAKVREAGERGKDAWKVIIESDKLSAEQMLKIWDETRVAYVLESAIKTNGLSVEKMLAVWNKAKRNIDVFWKIMETKKLSTKQILEGVAAEDLWHFWPTFDKYLDLRLSDKHLLELGHKFNHTRLWEAILETGRLSTKQLVKLLYETKDKDLLRIIIATRKLSPKQMLNVGNKAKDKDIWEEISQALKTK